MSGINARLASRARFRHGEPRPGALRRHRSRGQSCGASGFGWRLQGSLQKAFTYNLPSFFYCSGTTDSNGNTTPPGPGCINNTNLAVLPEANFGGQPTAIAGAPNGIASARVPYATGYGEVNWTGSHGQYYNLGVTYFGNNNSYNEPPFAVLRPTCDSTSTIAARSSRSLPTTSPAHTRIRTSASSTAFRCR